MTNLTIAVAYRFAWQWHCKAVPKKHGQGVKSIWHTAKCKGGNNAPTSYMSYPCTVAKFLKKPLACILPWQEASFNLLICDDWWWWWVGGGALERTRLGREVQRCWLATLERSWASGVSTGRPQGSTGRMAAWNPSQPHDWAPAPPAPFVLWACLAAGHTGTVEPRVSVLCCSNPWCRAACSSCSSSPASLLCFTL